MRVGIFLIAASFAVVGRGAAQEAAPPKARQTAGSVEAPAPQLATSYTYERGGRRDPFVSLLGPREAPVKRVDGPAGMALGEISVRGVVESQGALVAIIVGKDRKTYIVHEGDRLFDGTIKAINTRGLVVAQRVGDPLAPVKHHDVQKLLRSLEVNKE